MSIAPITIQDVDEIHSLGSEEPAFAFDNNSAYRFWTKEQLALWIENPEDILLKKTIQDKIVGFVLSQVHIPTKKATIENIYVVPSMRKQKIAQHLLDACVQKLYQRNIHFICAFAEINNTPSQSLLATLGFYNGGDFTWLYQMKQ